MPATASTRLLASTARSSPRRAAAVRSSLETAEDPRPDAVDHHVVVGRQDRVGGDQRVERLAQPPGGQRDADSPTSSRPTITMIDVAIELQVLEPVVQDVNRGAELMLGQASGQIAIRRTTSTITPGSCRASISGSSPERARSARMPSGSRTTTTPSLAARRAVAAAEDRRPLAASAQQARDSARASGVLPRAADGEIADADDGLRRRRRRSGRARIPLAPPARHCGVERRSASSEH